MKRLGLIGLFLIAGCASTIGHLKGCSASNRGGTYLVQVYSGGDVVAAYRVVGYVNTESQSDGWYFTTEDGKFHRVAGTVTIDEVKQ